MQVKRIAECSKENILTIVLYIFEWPFYTGLFMQTKQLCVSIHIWTKGEVGAVKLA